MRQHSRLKYLCVLLVFALLCVAGCGGETVLNDITSDTSSLTDATVGNSTQSANANSGGNVSEVVSDSTSNAVSSIEVSPENTGGVTSGAVDSSNVSVTSSNSAAQEDKNLKNAEEMLAQMSLDEKIAQLFIVEPEKLLNTKSGVTAYTGQAFQYSVGGVIFFAGNIKTPKQTTDFITDLQKKSDIPLFIAVDEEGGNVARVAKNSAMGTTAFPPMKEIKTESAAYNVGKTIGNEIKQFGFNLDLAPVADVADNPDAEFMKGRSFGSDPQTVSKLVASCVRGFKDSGMLCTLKHFPGKGNSSADSHYGYSELNKTLEEWRAKEKAAFKAGVDAGANFVMAGHYAMPKITGNETPATFSPQLIKMLRDELGYDGLIMTDSLQMGAITDKYGEDQVGVLALQAGADVLLMPKDLTKAFNGIKSAVESGKLTEERIEKSVLKILQLKFSSGIISG